MTTQHAATCRIAYSHCTCGLGDKPEPEDDERPPLPMAQAVGAALDEIQAAGAQPTAPAIRWRPDDLWDGVPPEFQGAQVPESIRTAFKQSPRPVSFAIVGQPGTGKTRCLWALFHRARANAMAYLLGKPVERLFFSEGEYTRKLETVPAAITRACTAYNRVQIITEVGDIRAHRYNREALAEWTEWAGVLAVDDIGAIEPNEWVREAIYHLANERRAAGRVTVWTSNLPTDKLREVFGPAIASRILGGCVIEVGGNDRRLLA